MEIDERSTGTLYDRAGGESVVRAVLEDFYDQVLADIMIGFFFHGTDKQRLVDKELELTARLLGDTSQRYTGKPLRAAHAPHPIMGGHFERRMQLLREAMARHDLPQEVREAWEKHSYALRGQITEYSGSDCSHDGT